MLVNLLFYYLSILLLLCSLLFFLSSRVTISYILLIAIHILIFLRELFSKRSLAIYLSISSLFLLLILIYSKWPPLLLDSKSKRLLVASRYYSFCKRSFYNNIIVLLRYLYSYNTTLIALYLAFSLSPYVFRCILSLFSY